MDVRRLNGSCKSRLQRIRWRVGRLSRDAAPAPHALAGNRCLLPDDGVCCTEVVLRGSEAEADIEQTDCSKLGHHSPSGLTLGCKEVRK